MAHPFNAGMGPRSAGIADGADAGAVLGAGVLWYVSAQFLHHDVIRNI